MVALTETFIGAKQNSPGSSNKRLSLKYMFEYNKSNLRLVVATCWIKLDTRLIHHFLKLTLQHYIAFRVSGSCPHRVNMGPRQKEKQNRQYWRRCLSSYLKPFLKCSRSIQGKIMSSIEWITLILVTVETVNWFLFTFVSCFLDI